ncbi:hypothetical protein D3C87_440280 [compost metagenome]
MTRSLPFFIAMDSNEKMKKLFFDFILSKMLYFVYRAAAKMKNLMIVTEYPPHLLTSFL